MLFYSPLQSLITFSFLVHPLEAHLCLITYSSLLHPLELSLITFSWYFFHLRRCSLFPQSFIIDLGPFPAVLHSFKFSTSNSCSLSMSVRHVMFLLGGTTVGGVAVAFNYTEAVRAPILLSPLTIKIHVNACDVLSDNQRQVNP